MDSRFLALTTSTQPNWLSNTNIRIIYLFVFIYFQIPRTTPRKFKTTGNPQLATKSEPRISVAK